MMNSETDWNHRESTIRDDDEGPLKGGGKTTCPAIIGFGVVVLEPR